MIHVIIDINIFPNCRNLDTELTFLIPVILDKNFKKCQVFCNTRFLSDLVGKFIVECQIRYIMFTCFKSNLLSIIVAAWISRELKKLGSSIQLAKLNGENSHGEKDRVSKLFKEG